MHAKLAVIMRSQRRYFYPRFVTPQVRHPEPEASSQKLENAKKR